MAKLVTTMILLHYDVVADKNGVQEILSLAVGERNAGEGLALAAELILFIYQVDVTSTYLNGVLEEVVYMQQPGGFVDKKNPHIFCKLKKILYGLKQSRRKWNSEIHGALKKVCWGFLCTYQARRQGYKYCCGIRRRHSSGILKKI